ncbi:MAG TPA: SDR family oxidoreductase [Roseiflexaceae bacterium]|nr:SDR family oxidoreductase [Roseiflexaceae bacterium]
MQTDLKGKVVCVSGAARRVGRAIALEFAHQGAHLVIHHSSSDADAESAAQEAQALGVEALIVKANVADPSEVARMFETIRARYGRLDVMVNSAASFTRTPLLDVGYDEWQAVLGVNLSGPFLCTQHAAHLMIAGGRGGAIVNISDNSGLKPWKARPAHSVSKAGVIMLTQVSALNLAEHNIRVNCVVPGPVLRPAGEPEEVLVQIARGLPLGHIGQPNDIARACVFLASNDFATGSILRVDGGEGLAGAET